MEREEIKNFTWVLYDREKNTGSGPRPLLPYKYQPSPTSLSSFSSPQSSPRFLRPLQACHVGRPLPPRSSLPRSSARLSVTQASREAVPCRQDLGCFPSDLEPSCLFAAVLDPATTLAKKPLPVTPARMTAHQSVRWPLPIRVKTRPWHGPATKKSRDCSAVCQKGTRFIPWSLVGLGFPGVLD